MERWNPTSWQLRPAKQLPTYPDGARVEAVIDELRTLPPLVTSWEVEKLKSQLAEAADRIRAEARRRGYTEREILDADGSFDWNRLPAVADSCQPRPRTWWYPPNGAPPRP